MGELGPGEVVGDRFRLVKKLGAGGFGAVWLAEDARGGAPIALKVLRADKRDARVLGRFEREARVLEGLVHPRIARAIACDPRGSLPYLAMELAEGRSLNIEIADRLSRGVSFTDVEIGRIVMQLAGALSAAHEQRVVHRDLQPANVMVRGEGERVEIMVLDFGIAKILDDHLTQATTEGWVLGSPLYLSPEQLASKPVDSKSDLFTFGMIIFELLTLRHPFLRDDQDQPMSVSEVLARRDRGLFMARLPQRLTTGQRPRVSRQRPGADPALDRVLERALAPAPEDRPDTALLLAEELLSALHLDFGTEAPTAIAWDAATAPVFEDRPTDRSALVSNPLTLSLDPVVPQPLDRGGLLESDRTRAEPRPEPLRPRPRVLALPLLLGLVAVSCLITLWVVSKPERSEEVEEVEELGAEPPIPRAVAAPPVTRTETAAAPPAPVAEPAEAIEMPKLVPHPSHSAARARAPHGATPPVSPTPPAAPAPGIEELRALLAQARKSAGDGALTTRLTEKILAEADRLPDPQLRASIQRRARSSAMIFDLDGLSACIDQLSAKR